MAMASPLKRKGWRSSFVLSTNRLTKRRLQPTAEKRLGFGASAACLFNKAASLA
jgi:hypothetical protein